MIIAPDTPTMLPTPRVPASATVSALKLDIPLPLFFPKRPENTFFGFLIKKAEKK
jgi:hypothetical protein